MNNGFFARYQRGATMIEYALIVAVVSIAIVVAASTIFEDGIQQVGTQISNALSGDSGTGAGP
ncbi:hypothetical protein T5B8_15050 [Salinisphaera sp. T5B8]|uniref:Flp family type IVb pilin n=1 Tax=unclassified Salinisphaera TaxID=2649847 RepID=UPI0033429E99